MPSPVAAAPQTNTGLRAAFPRWAVVLLSSWAALLALTMASYGVTAINGWLSLALLAVSATATFVVGDLLVSQSMTRALAVAVVLGIATPALVGVTAWLLSNSDPASDFPGPSLAFLLVWIPMLAFLLGSGAAVGRNNKRTLHGF